jgi:hypothetical protein
MKILFQLLIAMLMYLNGHSQSFCEQNKLDGDENPKVYIARGFITGGYVPDGGDVWGSAIFKDEKTKKTLALSYFGMALHDGEALKNCVICCAPYRYKKQKVEVQYTYNYEWTPIAIEGVGYPLDTFGYSKMTLGKIDSIVIVEGILQSYEMGDAALYITIQDNKGAICEFNSGYAEMKHGNSEDYINKNIRVAVVRRWNYNLKKCKIISN